MTIDYTSRIVGVGMYNSRPLVSFTLASESKPYRELRVSPKGDRINVFPRPGYENDQSNTDPDVDNYACIVAGTVPALGASFLVAFNGHMSKRTAYNLKDNMNPLMALDQTLLEFRGLHHDARIGGVSYVNSNGVSLYLGVNNTDKQEKRVCAYPNGRRPCLENRLLYIFDRDTDLEKECVLPPDVLTPDYLARWIHENIRGGALPYGAATGVALLVGQKPVFGVHNLPVDEAMVRRWKQECGD